MKVRVLRFKMEKKASIFSSKIDFEGFEDHKSRVCDGCPFFLCDAPNPGGPLTTRQLAETLVNVG